MTPRSIILISLDEVRPDHLSCYGYGRIRTPAIDHIANEGVRFETCFASSDFTPVAMGTVITGKQPPNHGMRNPYSTLVGPSIAGILKSHDYATAAFAGNALLSRKNKFSEGFDHWNETSKETSWLELSYPDGRNEMFYEGNYSYTCLLQREECPPEGCADPKKCKFGYIPDFVKLAEAYQAVGMRITKPADVRPALDEAIKIKRPVVMDFQVSADENVWPMVPAGAAISEMIDGVELL